MIRDRLGAIFTELKYVAIRIGTRPCAGLAVKTVELIDLQQLLRSRHDPGQARSQDMNPFLDAKGDHLFIDISIHAKPTQRILSTE